MAAGSVIAAVVDFLEAMSPALFPNAVLPPVFLDEAAQEINGVQVHPPYVILKDAGGTNDWDSGESAVNTGSFTLETYAALLSTCDAIMAAILWANSTPSQKQGLAFAVLNLTAPYYGMTIFPMKDQHSYAGFLDYQGNRVHKVTQTFDVLSGVKGN